MTWNGTINPNDTQYDSGGEGGKTRWCSEGRKVLAPIGFERWKSTKGNDMLSVRFVCLDDLEGDAAEVGAHVWRNFALTENAVSFFVRFARAIGFLSPFNVFKDEDIQEVLSKGAVIGKVEEEVYQKKNGGEGKKAEVKFFDRYEGDWEPGWDKVCAAADGEWESYLEWREKNPRQSASNRPSAGGGGGGGGKGGGGQSRHMPAPDDDIPF